MKTLEAIPSLSDDVSSGMRIKNLCHNISIVEFQRG